MQCTPKCEWQIEAPWGELSHPQIQSPSSSPHLPPPPPLPPLPLSVLTDTRRQRAFNVISWGNPLAPPVFLAHGRQDCARTFQPLLQLMDSEEFYYVSVDMPGSGRSVPLPNELRDKATSTTGCLNIEVPEEPFNSEDREVTLILAHNPNNQDTNQAAMNVVTRDVNDKPRPKIVPAFYTQKQDKDFVVIQMDDEAEKVEVENDAQNNRSVNINNINLEADYNANLPAILQPNAEEIQHTPNSKVYSDVSDAEWTDIDEDDSELEVLTYHLQVLSDAEFQEKMINIDFLENTPRLEVASEDGKLLVLKPRIGVNTTSLTNAIKNLNIDGQKEMKYQSSKRKRGVKLTKIPSEAIVCNDHGGRQCPFATKSAFQPPSERGFSFAVEKRACMSSSLLRKLARGWAWRSEVVVKQSVEDTSQNAAQEVPQNCAASPVFEQDDMNLADACVLAECPHMPPGLIAWIHEFFKGNKMHQHGYSKRNGVDPWTNNVEATPVVTQDQGPIVIPPVCEELPQEYSYAPTAPQYSPGWFDSIPYMSYPTLSPNTRDFSLPGYQASMSAAPPSYELSYPENYIPQAGTPPQRNPTPLSPQSYFSQPAPSVSYDQSVPYPVQQDSSSCCYPNKLLNDLQFVPSSALWMENMLKNKEFYETGKGVKITRFHFVAAMEAAIKHLGWNKFIFIGHSMGSEIGLFYNSIHPGKITRMILCDPEPTFRRLQVRDLALYQSRFYDDYYNNYWKDNFYFRTYTYSQAKEALMKARNLTEDKASIILSGSLKHVEGDKYRFTWDRRLRMPAPQNYPNAYYFAIFSNIPPTLVISALDSLGEQSTSGSLELLNMLSTLKNYNHITVEGGHDVHLTHPERLAPHVIEFLRKEKQVNSKL